MEKDLAIIKDEYGENMSHLCKILFPQILEIEGLLPNILEANFAKSKLIYDDLVKYDIVSNFKNYILSKFKMEEEYIKTPYSIKELLKTKGYNIYECKTEEEVNKFRKYYTKSEELCTFDGQRTICNYVFFIVKEDVDKILRCNFTKPDRNDIYSTSVLSIQFSKGDVNTPSIISRYNHSVKNPNNTYESNLDKIVPGLARSFEREYGFNYDPKKAHFKMEDCSYTKAEDGKYYKFNYMINGIYYCPSNIIIKDEKITELKEKEKYILADYYLINLKDKTITLIDKDIKDSFIESIGNIKKIIVKKNKKDNTKTLNLYTDNGLVELVINKYNKIISYTNNNIDTINNRFMFYCNGLESITIDNVKKIGKKFLYNNKTMEEINIRNVLYIDDDFLYSNKILKKINIDSVKDIRDNFLINNRELLEFNAPSLIRVSNNCLFSNTKCNEVNIDNLEQVGNNLLRSTNELEDVSLSNLVIMGNNCFGDCENIKTFYAPKLIKAGNGLLKKTKKIDEINIESIEELGDYFLYSDNGLKEINIKNIKKLGSNCLYTNNLITSFITPNLEELGEDLLVNNGNIKDIDFSSLRKAKYTLFNLNKPIIFIAKYNINLAKNKIIKL